MEWSNVLVESCIPNYSPMDEEIQAELGARIYNILLENLPDNVKYRWKSVWCDGQALLPDATDVLANDLMATRSSEYFTEDLSDGSYIRGSVGRDAQGDPVWIRWGVGCPMDSGCDEILTLEWIG